MDITCPNCSNLVNRLGDCCSLECYNWMASIAGAPALTQDEWEAWMRERMEQRVGGEQEARERGARTGPYRPYNAIDVISRAEPSDGIGLGGRVVKGRPKKAPDGRL